jgi:wobble nucleotide-excising tRNase
VLKKLKSASNMGVFKDFRAADDECDFKKLNLLYGFNGSGKTTLARVFSSLEKGALCSLLPAGGRFEIELEDGIVISNENNLDALKSKIAVFSTDFVEENFHWKAGSAKPVFYIGRDQAEAGKELHEAELKRAPLQTRNVTADDAKSKAERDFATYKTNTARIIGEQIADRNFNARSLDRMFSHGDPDQDASLEVLSEELRLERETVVP